MHADRVMPDNAPMGCDRLNQVSFQYVDFEAHTQCGHVVVLDAVAKCTQAIFDSLYERKFLIHKAVLMERY
jgi:hypothetical protein